MFTRTAALLTLLICPLAACSDPAPPDPAALSATFCLDGLPPEKAEVFERAMEHWNERTGVTTWARSAEGFCEWRVVPVPAGDQRLRGHSAYTWRGEVFYAEGFKGLPLLNVALHELGHVAHLGHSRDEADVMWPHVTPVVELTPADLEMFHSVNF